jgi:hypothetical protein
LRFARIAEQLAAPLQIGAGAGHLGGEAESTSARPARALARVMALEAEAECD